MKVWRLVCGGDVAVGLEAARNSGARNEIAGELDIERRQGKGLVVDHLDGRPATSEDDYRPKRRIIGEPRDEVTRLRPHDHRLDNNAGDSCFRPNGSNAIENLRCCTSNRRRGRKVQAHAADVRLVLNVLRQDLKRNRQPGPDKLCSLARRFIRIRRENRRHHRDTVPRKQGGNFERVEPNAPIRKRAIDYLARR